MPIDNCCSKCSRFVACAKHPRSRYFCMSSPENGGFCALRCQPLRCFRGGPPPEVKGQTRMFEEKKP